MLNRMICISLTLELLYNKYIVLNLIYHFIEINKLISELMFPIDATISTNADVHNG